MGDKTEKTRPRKAENASFGAKTKAKFKGTAAHFACVHRIPCGNHERAEDGGGSKWCRFGLEFRNRITPFLFGNRNGKTVEIRNTEISDSGHDAGGTLEI